jgi:argininosuccinate synthase
MKKKVVLAYSGGLDTSVIICWLAEQGYEVIALCVDVGQKIDDLEAIKQKAFSSGAIKALVVDTKEEFVRDFVLPGMQFHALYEGSYLLGTALARPLIAKAQIEVAKEFGAEAVSHGATGKGNDQVRFELAYYSLAANIEVVAPWKMPEFFEKYPGRKELLDYARLHNIPVKASAASPWSCDENLLHMSYESGILEDAWQKAPKEMYELTTSPQDAPDTPEEVTITFEKGVPVRLGEEKLPLLKLFLKLNALGSKHGIGRIDIVESRFVGMKSRGIYETPGGSILMQAHKAIESISLTSDSIDLKENIMPRFAKAVYQGFWFTPQMEMMLALLQQSQKDVEGEVRLELYKGNVSITGRKSKSSLYNQDIASMEKDSGDYSPQDAKGFIKLNALPFRIYQDSKKS